MADFNASLPIRTENAGDVQMKLVDGTNTAQVLKIEADGSINANISTGNLDVRDLVFATDKVDVSGSAVTVSATDLDIRNLAFASDKVDASGSSVSVSNFPSAFEVSNFASITDLDIRNLAYASDSVTAHLAAGSQIEISNASLEVTATGLDTRKLAFADDKVDVSGSSVTVSASALDIRHMAFADDKMDVSGSSISVSNFPTSFEVSNFPASFEVSNTVTVQATGLDIRALSENTDSIKVSTAMGSYVTARIEDLYLREYDYQAASAIAAGGSSEHLLATNPNGYRYVEGIRAAASGKLKIELQVEQTPSMGDYQTVAIAYNSAANPNIEMQLDMAVRIPSNCRAKLVLHNRDAQAQDLHSTMLIATNMFA